MHTCAGKLKRKFDFYEKFPISSLSFFQTIYFVSGEKEKGSQNPFISCAGDVSNNFDWHGI
jgi:hypothetical protein